MAYPLASPQIADLWKLSGHAAPVPAGLLDEMPLGTLLDPAAARKVHN